MPWQGYHLYEFRVGENRFGVPDPEWADEPIRSAKGTRLAALIKRGVTTFAYLYDFGDDWRHTVSVISVRAVEQADPAREYPRFVVGERRAPPENVGGVDGFSEFLKAATRPRHREHKEVLTWYGGPFDPEDVSQADIEARIGKLARRRLLGRAAYLKSQGGRH